MKRKFREVITANNAASHAALLARAQFIAAYPITPQTTIVEQLATLCQNRKDIIFKPVESEHSAMAACIGASIVGMRTFTATSSHGLALMHEMLHWATGARLPIVMVNVNRAMGTPWNIHTEQTDSLSQRDTGWLQIYCSSNQEVLDTVIQAFAVAETVHLPIMICLDGFLLSHTAEPVEIPRQELVDKFLLKRKPAFKLDVNNPSTFGCLHLPEHYMELRKDIEDAHFAALETIKKVNYDFSKVFNRNYAIIEKHQTNQANTIIITNGTTAATAKIAVEQLRKGGSSAGFINLRVVRPFPKEELLKAVKNSTSIIVIDRSFTSNQGGILAQEIKSALYNTLPHTKIISCIMGLGGRDISVKSIKEVFYKYKESKTQDIHWIGVKNG